MAPKRPAGESLAAPSMALVVKKFWCDKIFHSTKTWELRGQATTKRGRICLAQSKSSMLVGEATLTQCLRVGRMEGGQLVPWSSSGIDRGNFVGAEENFAKHCVEDLTIIKYKKVYAWVLEDRVSYDHPRPYTAKKGAVVWRKLS